MARVPFIAGNWKLNLGPPEAAAAARDLRARVAGLQGCTLAVFPTALAIPAVVEALAGSAVGTGVQEIEVAQDGAFTGANE